MTYHKPVLLKESIDGLNIKPGGIYADLTFGGGGHSREILGRLGEQGRLIAFDQDRDAEKNSPDDPRFTFIHANFRFLKNFLRYLEIQQLDGILADLGISSYQVDEENRGFTFRENVLLDMRMNTESATTAEKVLNEYSKEELNRIFRDYGELINAAKISEKICIARENMKIRYSHDLIEIVEKMTAPHLINKMLAKLFQALRIEVNDELGALKDMLGQIEGVLCQSGRLAILSYHSLEDRLVKNLVKTGNVEGKVKKDFYGNRERIFVAVDKNIITPGENELKMNSRARSAKLRIAEKI